MRRLLRLLILPAALLLSAVSAVPAAAEDRPEPVAPATDGSGVGDAELRARLELVRQMSPEQREQLREALRRFRSLPFEEREALRAKADRLGTSRLKHLAGRDPRRLRRRHHALEGELRQVFELIGEERLAGLGEDERRHVHHQAMRRFQDHIRRRLMALGGVAPRPDPAAESRGSRLKVMERCVGKVCESLLEELPEAERERLAALPAEQRRAAQAELLREFRRREIHNFAQNFDRYFLQPYLARPAEERAAVAERTARESRWFEAAGRLEELGLPRRVIWLTRVLAADDMARLGRAVEETSELDPASRRLELEKVIRELHGRASTDEGRGGPGRQGRLFRRLNGHGRGRGPGTREAGREDRGPGPGREGGGRRRGGGGRDREPEEPR